MITEIAESNSGKIKPTLNDFKRLEDVIKVHRPLTVVLIHGKVLKGFLKYLNRPVPRTNTGILGKLIEGIPTTFFNIAFPHGNSISDLRKIMEYRQLKDYIETLQ